MHSVQPHRQCKSPSAFWCKWLWAYHARLKLSYCQKSTLGNSGHLAHLCGIAREQLVKGDNSKFRICECAVGLQLDGMAQRQKGGQRQLTMHVHQDSKERPEHCVAWVALQGLAQLVKVRACLLSGRTAIVFKPGSHKWRGSCRSTAAILSAMRALCLFSGILFGFKAPSLFLLAFKTAFFLQFLHLETISLPCRLCIIVACILRLGLQRSLHWRSRIGRRMGGRHWIW